MTIRSSTIDVTLWPVATSTPSLLSDCVALTESTGENADSIRSPPSTSRILADVGSMERKSFLSVSREISATAPASSTPVGPPPIMTKVRSNFLRCSSFSSSAFSKAVKIRARISRASSSVLSPGAMVRHELEAVAHHLEEYLRREQPRAPVADRRGGR